MTPQQRHINAARRLTPAYVLNANAEKVVIDSIARALSEAENRAAWRVWGKCETLCDIDKTKREISEDYGPRPSRGEVGDE